MALRTLHSSATSAFQYGLKRSMNRALAQPTIEFNRTINFSHGKSSLIIDPNNTHANNTNKINITRHIHSSSMQYQANKDLFTPSPFARSSKINVSDKFVIHRDLKEPDNAYGIRRYLLLPRSPGGGDDDERYDKKKIIASLNANRHILFGAQLHVSSSPAEGYGDDEYDEYISNYLAACGSLLDIAREDASVNGQQVQALASLNGLCSWVTECLDNDGEGSEVLMGLMHNKKPTNDDDNDKKEEKDKLPSGKRSNQKITQPSDNFTIQKKTLRRKMLESVRAIATGEPRPGHSVVGAGTYRDGEKGWVALAKEYSALATNPDSVSLDASYVGRKGLEEVALYNSRDGQVTQIEHLGHVEPGYLKEAGGAMARVFFV